MHYIGSDREMWCFWKDCHTFNFEPISIFIVHNWYIAIYKEYIFIFEKIINFEKSHQLGGVHFCRDILVGGWRNYPYSFQAWHVESFWFVNVNLSCSPIKSNHKIRWPRWPPNEIGCSGKWSLKKPLFLLMYGKLTHLVETKLCWGWCVVFLLLTGNNHATW